MNKKLVIISIIFLALITLNILTSMPLERGDNYYEILAAKGILKYNLKPLGDYDLFQHKSEVIMNHSPAFNYLLALLLFIFKKDIALNFIGLIFMILTAFLLIKTIRLVYRNVSDTTIIIISFLFFLTPIIVQGSYLVDLDTILPFVMILFVYFYLKNPNRIILNSFLFMLIWMTKIQGVLIMVLSLLVYLILNKKSSKEYINAFFIVLIGSAAFLFVLLIYSQLFNIGFSRMFAHSSIIDTIIKQLINYKKTVLTSFWTIKQIIIWIIPSTFLLYLFGLFGYFKDKLYKKYDKILLPILISIFTLLELIPIGTYGWNFPKYYLEFIPFMLISIIFIIEKIKIEKKDIWKIGILVLIFIPYFLMIPDLYLPEVSDAFTVKNYFELFAKVLFNFDLLIFPMIVTFLLFCKNLNRDKIYKILLISSIIILISVNIMQITKPYSTNNLYGDSHKDLISTLDYLKTNTNSSDLTLLFPHVGYYFGNEDNTNWYNSMLCYNSESCMKNITDNKTIKFMQFYPKDLERLNGNLKNIIEKEFKYDRRFGEYIIYKRK